MLNLKRYDEIYKTAPGLGEIIIAYQHYKREGRNVALILAGLPKSGYWKVIK
jgi:hypothetical protein